MIKSFYPFIEEKLYGEMRQRPFKWWSSDSNLFFQRLIYEVRSEDNEELNESHCKT